jgi:hypothetical protein
MTFDPNRRDFLQLAGVGGLVFASRLAGAAPTKSTQAGDFFFLQLSDTHWGFSGPPNPEADKTLISAVQTINSAGSAPDFVLFTGDLTHTTEDGALRRQRMRQFKEIVSGLRVKTVRFLPGEHDAALDRGAAYREIFGELHYAFDHKGIHFVALDNVSDPEAKVGDAQIDWLASDLKAIARQAPIVVFAHRPLFDLYPQWDWSTKDGGKVIDVLLAHDNVTVFYGHIHQEHHKKTEHIAHHAARSLMFALPPPGSVPKRAPIAWDPAEPYKGLGYRSVEAHRGQGELRIAELAVRRG